LISRYPHFTPARFTRAPDAWSNISYDLQQSPSHRSHIVSEDEDISEKWESRNYGHIASGREMQRKISQKQEVRGRKFISKGVYYTGVNDREINFSDNEIWSFLEIN
jgi:hypothetical protein